MNTKLVINLCICFVTTFIFSCSGETATTGSIDWWCTQIPHYQTCNHYLAVSNTSTATISINEFLGITVHASIDEARVVLTQAQGKEADYPSAPGKSVWRSCVDYFDGVVYTLNTILDHTDEVPRPEDVHAWISDCLTYISMCEKEFESVGITNNTLSVISTNLTELLLNSVAISVVITGSDTPSLDKSHFINEHKLLKLAMNIQPNVIVAKDGSGNFTTVQEAVNSAGDRRWGQRYVIYVKTGVYEEQVVIPQEVKFITMYGDGINNTIISANHPSGSGLKESSTFQVWGRRFVGFYLTFRNTAGPDGGQAVAFLSGSDMSALYRCSFEGYQDTLFTFKSRQFYKECQISGTIDFIFGASQAMFQDCDISLRKPNPGGGLVVTANGRENRNASGGYSLQKCKIHAADDLKSVIGEYKKAFLGRPWFPFARTVFMQSSLDDLVDPLGWTDGWGFNKTAYCGEYENYGPGSSTDQRVKWPHYQAITDPNIAQQFTVVNFIQGDEWLPTSGVPFDSGL